MRALALTAILVILAGCAETQDPPAAGGSTTGDGTLLLLLHERYWVNATGDAALVADLGPHCANATYTASPPSLEYWVEPGGAAPGGLLLRLFDSEDHRRGHVASIGSGVDDLPFDPAGDRFEVASAFDAGRVLALLVVDDGRVWVNGAMLGEEPIVQRASVTKTQDGRPFEVTEHLRFEPPRILEPTVREKMGLCD